MTMLASAFALGLVGSGHCVLMCGPLVSLMAPADASWQSRWRHAALYHGGRVAVYVAIGAIAGGLGRMVVLVGMGRVLTVAAGLLLIASAFGVARPRWWPRAGTRAADAAVTVLRRLRHWTHAHRSGPAASGAVNGLLPCGLVYGAVAATAGLGAIADGAAFMAAFGLGTMPVLLAIGLSRGAIAPSLSSRLRRLAPVALVVVGVLLIARGLTGSAIEPHSDTGRSTHVAHTARR